MALASNVLMFVFLRLGFPVITVLYLILAAGIGYLINAIIIVDRTTSLKFGSVVGALIRVSVVLIIGSAVLYGLNKIFDVSILSFLVFGLVSFICVLAVSYFIVAVPTEREYLKKILKGKFVK